MILRQWHGFCLCAEDEALFAALRAGIAPNVELIEMDNNINDNDFAVAAAQKLLDLLEECS